MEFHSNSLYLSLLTAVLFKCVSTLIHLSILPIAHSTGMLRSLQSQQLITKRRHRSWAPSLPHPSQNKTVSLLLTCYWYLNRSTYNHCDLKTRKQPKPNIPTSEEICIYCMPVCFGYLSCNPKTRSCSHPHILQPCNCTSSDSSVAYHQQPN